MITSKITSSSNLLEQLSQYYDFVDITKFKDTIKKEQKYLQKSSKLGTKTAILQQFKYLMTHEGRIAESYWRELEKIFSHLHYEFNFKGRKNKSNSRNYNASDEINASLNYGYTILESQKEKINFCTKLMTYVQEISYFLQTSS